MAPGDRVLVRKVGLKGMQKLADRWSEETYVVVDQPSPGIPVYRVKTEGGRSHMKTLHRNLLLPISVLPLSKPEPVPVPHKTKLQGPPVETLVEQPPLMTKTLSESGTDDDSYTDSVVDVRCARKPHQVPVALPGADFSPFGDENANLGVI